eukprot:7390038-Prymnesium_polylepis.5
MDAIRASIASIEGSVDDCLVGLRDRSRFAGSRSLSRSSVSPLAPVESPSRTCVRGTLAEANVKA